MSANTVWLASYPKSGNTWVRALLAALDTGSVAINSSMGGSTIASARGPIEYETGLSSSELRRDEVRRLRPAVDAILDARVATPWPRKIHDALFSGLDGGPIVEPAATRAAICVVRDPRDVAVSFAHHQGVSVAEAVATLADPAAHMGGGAHRPGTQVRQELGTWSTHVTGWLDHGLFEVLLVRYEDLRADPLGQLRRIAAVVGRAPTEEQLTAAVAATSFDQLRAQEAAGGFREQAAPERAFFRRGIAGGWRDELDPGLAAQVEQDHGDVMRRLDYL